MVLRKPYAFLIKHFRLIHGILAIFMSFLFYKSYELYKFYNEYFNEGLFNSLEAIASKYITITMFLAIIVICAIILTILLLMNFKKKPIKYYFTSFILYLVLIFIFVFIRIQLKKIEWNEIDIKIVKITRDISLVTFLSQIPFLIVTLVRSIGFNIKKFNFEKDLKEFQIDDVDNEEFEVGVNLDQNDINTIIRRRIRIIRYTIKENKYILLALFAIMMIITGVMIYVNDEIYNKIYKEKEVLNTSSIELSVLNSYQLDTNTSNNDITDNHYSYVVAVIRLKNKLNTNISTNLSNFRLRTGEFTSYEVDTSYYNSFIEFGIGYNSQTIKSKNTENYILVFKIKKEEKNKAKQLEYLTSALRKNGELIFNYAKFNLQPQTLEKTTKEKAIALAEEIDLSKSLLKKSTLTINKVEFNTSFIDKNRKCISSKCYDTNTYVVPTSTSKYQKIVMKIEYSLKLDESINPKVKDKFISKFGNIRYVIDGKNYSHGINLVDITPNSNDNYSYLEVKEEVQRATKIYLDIKVRDKVYTYIVKE